MTEKNETIASETDKPAARRDSRLFEFVVGAGVLLFPRKAFPRSGSIC